ncbi:MAG: response regulator [Treponema sp.]|nr:response regulator [Treponema sp.]
MESGTIENDSRFIASTLHEIRTPIQTIISTTELLEDTALNKEQREYVRQIEFGANVLLQLANDVLDYTKITSDDFQLENIPFDLIEMTEKVADLICIEAFNKGLEIITSIDYSIPKMLMGDPTRVQQILLNLCKNAVKFTQRGFIQISVRRINNDIYYEVMDSGIGVPTEKQQLIFNRFYQVDASTTRKFGGTGLGLSICKNLVKIMGGEIGMRANPTGGSIFWFTLPLRNANLDSEKSFKLEVPESTRVLIVDDNSLGLNSLTDKLLAMGVHSVETADCGPSALKKIKAAKLAGNPFTIAFLDMIMPVWSGWRLAAEINNDPEINDMKLYLMIPEGQLGGDAKMKLLNWFNGYLYKPIKRNSLLNTLVEAFTQSMDLPHAENESLRAKILEAERASEKDDTKVFDDANVAKGKSILVAEDHPVNQKIIETFLKHYGATVYLADNGQEAVEQIKEHPQIDMIFMDMLMPVKSGLDATVELRHSGYKGIIIACTANNDKDDFAEYRKQGINDILVKPFKRVTIKQTLEKWGEVLSIYNAKSIISLTNISATTNQLWDSADFMDTVGEDKILAKSIIQKYICATEDLLEQIKAELNKDPVDFVTVEKIAHTLKGSSASVSSEKLMQTASVMNEAAKNSDFTRVEASRTDFAIDFLELKNTVKNWLTSL